MSEKLGARALRLDDSRKQQEKRQQQQQQQQQQRKQQLKLSRTQAKRLGLFDVAAEFGSSSSSSRRKQQQHQEKGLQQQQQKGLGLQEMLPLYQLWQQYALSVCGLEATAAAAAAGETAGRSSSSSRKQKGGGPSGGPQGPPKLSAYSRCGVAAQMDLHGAWVSVHRSSCPSLCGIAGLVILDTQQVRV